MAAFEYTALDEQGQHKKGVLEADSPRQIRQLLRDKGWAPLTVEATVEKQQQKQKIPRWLRARSISTRDLALVTRQLAALIQSGLPVEEALRAVSQQSEKGKIQSMMLAIRARILEGHTLANSLADFPGAFPKLYRATVEAGEHAGHLDLVLNSLADYTESRQQSQQKIQLALLYPVILVIAAISIVSFLLSYVVPKVVKVFDNTGHELPQLTKSLIATSHFMGQYGVYLLIGIILMMMLFNYALKNQAFRFKVHRLLLRFPLVGRLTRDMNTARFCSTLSILSSSGVPLVEALAISGQVVTNDCIREAIGIAAQRVREGTSLKIALEQSRHFPPMMLHMIASGETGGDLDDMLARAAANQERDLQTTIAMLVGVFEPMMLLLMGGMVMVIVLAIMMPIMNMNQLIGK